MVVIGYVAYDKVGDLYDSGAISGSAAGSFVHWVIRAALFVTIWAITYGIIWVGKFIMAHKIQSIICACIILTVVLVIMLLFWMEKKKKLAKVFMRNKNRKDALKIIKKADENTIIKNADHLSVEHASVEQTEIR